MPEGRGYRHRRSIRQVIQEVAGSHHRLAISDPCMSLDDDSPRPSRIVAQSPGESDAGARCRSGRQRRRLARGAGLLYTATSPATAWW